MPRFFSLFFFLLDVVMACDPGTYLLAETTVCVDCAPGNYSQTTDAAACLRCPAGKYQSAAGATACVTCATGSYTSVSGATVCLLCNAGSSNTYARTGCVGCWAGKYSAFSGDGCNLCNVGTYAPANFATTCLNCPTGLYAPTTGAKACNATCPVGHYSPAANTCTKCLAGTYGATLNATACSACALGYYSAANGSTTCTACALGKYAAATASTACSPCPAGTYGAITGASACTPCVPGTFCSVAGGCTSYCTECDRDTTADYGASACSACPVATAWWINTDPISQMWPIGVCFADGDSCVAGSYALSVTDGAHIFCAACPSGTFSSQDGASACTACPEGTYSEQGATTCVMCVANDTYSPPCQPAPCAAGTYMAPLGGLLVDLTIVNATWSSALSSTTNAKCGAPWTQGLVWCAANASGIEGEEWLQYDLGSPTIVTEFVTYGMGSSGNWTASYNVSYSLDGQTWISVGLFQGNVDDTSAARSRLRLITRYIRWQIVQFSGWPVLNARVRGYAAQTCIPCSPGTYSITGTLASCLPCPFGTYSNTWGAANCTIVTQDYATASEGIGMQVVSNRLQYYASSWGALPTNGLPVQWAALNNPWSDAWVAGTSQAGVEYLIMDLGGWTQVHGIVTQGRKQAEEWVVAYDVFSSLDLSDWSYVQNFAGNADQESLVVQFASFTAQYVKLVPTEYHEWISMRAAVLIGPPLTQSLMDYNETDLGIPMRCALSTGLASIALCPYASTADEFQATCCRSVFEP